MSASVITKEIDYIDDKLYHLDMTPGIMFLPCGWLCHGDAVPVAENGML